MPGQTAEPSKRRSVAIVQSNYIPWKGYFDLIARVDQFILLDDVQYTHRDWRNRNLIKTADGPKWLSVPVRHERTSRVADVTIATDQGDWRRKHLGTIEHAYRDAPHAATILPWLAESYGAVASVERLSELNRKLIDRVCDRLGITTPVALSTDYFTLQELDAFEPTQRLLALCQAAGATSYLSGPAARAYMDTSLFSNQGIEVEWMDYAGYREYPQLHGEFTHGVSVVDVLLMTGPDAATFLKHTSGSERVHASA